MVAVSDRLLLEQVAAELARLRRQVRRQAILLDAMREAWLASTAREIHEGTGTWPSVHELANAASHGLGYRPARGVLNRVLFVLTGNAEAGATPARARGGKAGVRR